MQNTLFEQFFDLFYSNNDIITFNDFTKAQVKVRSDEFSITINMDETSVVSIKKNVFLKYFELLIQNRNITLKDIKETSTEVVVFNMLKLLPFVEAESNKTIKLKNFSTSDLPGHFNDSMNFLSDQIIHNRELILRSSFFKLIFSLLENLGTLPPHIKRNMLLEIMYLTIQSSTTGTPFSSDQQGIDHIHSYISNKGFYYEQKEIINLYLSLKTKPFVILSGISGTGKTKIVQLFAESLGATADNGQFALIPVRPDWSDGSDLIGYRDIKGDFQAGPFTKVLIEANKPENRDNPYFVLLDEMNLARVEYYFSDLLSVMES
jgi:AAA domain (dynein-related subfamily)